MSHSAHAYAAAAVCREDPALDAAFVREHLARMDADYTACFAPARVAAHCAALTSLSVAEPVRVLCEPRPDGLLDCTILAFDHPYEFALIAGVLASLSFDVRTGDVFTHAAERPDGEPTVHRRCIVDRFSGVIPAAVTPAQWQRQAHAALNEVVGLLERGGPDAPAAARARVNQWIAAWLSREHVDTHNALFPVRVAVDNTISGVTRLRVETQDTPAFLYTLANALARHGVRIERVVIRTINDRIEDEFDVTDARGEKISDEHALDAIKLSILLTKQFTCFLAQAPDPYAALSRFEQLIAAVLHAPRRGRWLDILANPHALRDLARVLGASDFLWEDFIRQQYETLLPMLAPHVEGRRFGEAAELLEPQLQTALAHAADLETQRTLLNEFKDREIFLADLDQILGTERDFRRFAERLTALAEIVIRAALEIAGRHLHATYGTPRTAAGAPAQCAVLGLGKLGGAALGYASDIELLFVYSDSGETDGAVRTSNADYFHRLAQQTALSIRAKREGIFQVDLRLRPYGGNSPLAASLEQFCRYYGPGGAAADYERLALVRLRAVAGDAALGARVERLRDEIVYAASLITPARVLELRRAQCAAMARGARPNAKFSPGGLVDVEYAVQLLQVLHAPAVPTLRTPRIHHALDALRAAGVLEPDETEHLTAAYDFLRRLINAMRMLRGNAKDMFLPAPDDAELAHLARRMGCEESAAPDAAQRLQHEFELHTAVVRAFTERHFGRDAIPHAHAGTVADIVLAAEVPDALRERVLRAAGFADTARACRNLRGLAGAGARRQFARLALLACDVLRALPDPDMALNNWERFSGCVEEPGAHFAQLLAQPVRLEILMAIFAGSQFLAETLMQTPGLFAWITTPDTVQRPRARDELERELRAQAAHAPDADAWRAAIRRTRRREILRIGTRDLWLRVPLEETVRELAELADAIVAVAFDQCWSRVRTTLSAWPDCDDPARHCCVMAFGKLGGAELNYSSDIDLLGLSDDGAFNVIRRNGRVWTHKELYARLLEELRRDLADTTADGIAYRVDYRLRPHGGAGDRTPSVSAALDYYRAHARPWELQAALKLRPIAGNRHIGAYFLTMLRPLLARPRDRREVVDSIKHLRRTAVRKTAAGLAAGIDVKNGAGGIRDIEFAVQGLQLIHAHARPELLEANTLAALAALRDAGIIAPAAARQLHDDYCFLRRIEHFLQILEDQQLHAVPVEGAALTALARRVGNAATTSDEFLTQLRAAMQRVATLSADLLQTA